MLDMIRQARILAKIMSTLLRISHPWQMDVIDSSVIIVYKESGADLGVGVVGWWWWCPPSFVLFVYSTIEDGLASHPPYFHNYYSLLLLL